MLMMKNVDFFRRFLVQCYDINGKSYRKGRKPATNKSKDFYIWVKK